MKEDNPTEFCKSHTHMSYCSRPNLFGAAGFERRFVILNGTVALLRNDLVRLPIFVAGARHCEVICGPGLTGGARAWGRLT